MPISDDALHVELMRVIRAEAHGSGRMIYGCFRLAHIQLDPAAKIPAPSEIWIENQSTLN
jgi:hypothetical protein